MSGVVLLTGAFAPEIDRLTDQLEGKPLPAGFHPPGAKFECLESGVGNLESALNLQRRILDQGRPPVAEVLFFGSAGYYPVLEGKEDPVSGNRFGTSHVFYALEMSVLTGMAKAPTPLVSRATSQRGPLGTGFQEHLPFLDGDCNSPDSITLVAPAPDQLNPPGENRSILFENMEAFGLARASGGKVPFTPFFSLTNRVGKDGSLQWAENYRQMSDRLQRTFLTFLSLSSQNGRPS